MQMKHLLIALIFVSLFNLSLEKPHKCIQDALEIDLVFGEKPEDEQKGGRNLAERENIRVTFDFSTLDAFTGDMIPLANEVKRQTELSGQYFAKSLKVNRQTSNLKFPSNQSVCYEVQVPSADKTVGIPNSDLHIYVNVFNDAQSNTLAYAAPCILNYNDGRPIFGIFAVNLAYFQKEDVGKHNEFEDNFETIAHELTHILGFSSSMYQYFINPATGRSYGRSNEPIITETIRGISTKWITTPKVKQLAQDYYGCSSAKGMQLENEGGSGSAHSHWERVVLENDYMTASAIGHDAVFSRFTLALLEDSGWYTPTYEYVDDIDWGKGQGCDFLYNCNSNTYREFNSESRQCNFYHSSIAYASTNDNFGDQCVIPQVISSLYCSDSNNSSGNDKYTGSTFSELSRCFDGNIMDRRIGSHSYPNHRCMSYKCNEDATKIEVYVQGETYTIEKQANLVQISPKGKNTYIQGTLYGPEDWNGFCNTYPLPCPNYCSSQGFCLAKTCHCHTHSAGKDCSVSCPNDNYIHNGQCLNSKTCPQGTAVHAPTKECIASTTVKSLPEEPNTPVICQSGQFKNSQNQCQACPSDCKECFFQDFCYECRSGYRLEEVNGQVTCQQIEAVGSVVCTNGQFKTAFNVCQECHLTCATCSDANSCNTCAAGHFMNTTKQQCDECYKGCATCSSYSECTTCISGYKLLSHNGYNVCMSKCPTEFIESNGKCILQ